MPSTESSSATINQTIRATAMGADGACRRPGCQTATVLPITVPGICVQNGDPVCRRPGNGLGNSSLRAGTHAADARGMSFRPKVAVSFPPTQESKVLAEWLSEDGFEPIGLSSHTRLEHELTHSAVKLLVVDAAFAVAAINVVRARHPMLPIVVVGDTDPSAEAYAKTRGALYLTRPVDR